MGNSESVHPSISIDDLDKAITSIGGLVRQDIWQNIATGLGVENKDHRKSARYKHGREITRGEYDAMYIEDPVFAKIVDGIPEHGTRKWIKVTAQETEGEDGSNDVESDFAADVLSALEDLDAQQQIFECWRLSRLDGGAAIILGADDGKKAEEPLDLKSIKSLKHLNVVTRFEIFPIDIINDITSPFYREPMFYNFTGRGTLGTSAGEDDQGVFRSTPMAGLQQGGEGDVSLRRIHHSRVIRMRGINVTESQGRTLQGSSQTTSINQHLWGVPIVQRVYDDLRQYNTIFSHVEAGFKDLSQGIMGVKNLPEILSTTQGNELLLKRMALIALAASSFNMVLFDPEHESYEKRPGGFAGIDKVLLRFMEKLSSASEIPMTKLFGMPPAGLSADDQSAEKTFNASIANKQRRKLRDPLNRIVEALLNADDGPTGGQAPESWKVTFLPLDEPNEKEQAETDQTRAETDTAHLLNGTLTAMEVRSRMKNDPDQPYTLSTDRDEAMAELERPIDQTEAEKMAAQLRQPGEPGADPIAAGQTVPTEQGGVEDLQKTALNGAQVEAALEMVRLVTVGELPKAAAEAMLVRFFNLEPTSATQIMASVVEGSVEREPASAPAPTPAPGGAVGVPPIPPRGNDR